MRFGGLHCLLGTVARPHPRDDAGLRQGRRRKHQGHREEAEAVRQRTRLVAPRPDGSSRADREAGHFGTSGF
jgi:hypothetical protein